ncbi:hypothetical protein GSI_02763 [Ganoderma sinense ZZ0214-1]|uniref:Uncharacterized protein n=1 Tax=Ganoderma sinense ZZ0214-1 TaxID=1077348 RepID=A0A2G8SMI3_9APHY|nr:hypothetical protein GSI_02763 [Ganoderma sinense ZZ0214-1]
MNVISNISSGQSGSVTNACYRPGFGYELTKIVFEKGDTAITTARRLEVHSDLVAAHPSDRLLTLKLDVTKQRDILDVFAAAKYATMSEVETVAAVGGGAGADVRAMFEANFWGAANVSHEMVPFFGEVNPAGGFCTARRSRGSSALGARRTTARASLITIIEPSGFDAGSAIKAPWAPAHPVYTKPGLPIVIMRKATRGKAWWRISSPRWRIPLFIPRSERMPSRL